MLDWAAKVDAGPFASVAALDRVVFPSHEPLVVLAAVAIVTTRVRLLTSIVLAPTRETTLLARQAAASIRTAYAFDPTLAERRSRGIPTTSSAGRALLLRQAVMGVQEVVLRPCAPDSSLVDRSADLVAGID